MSIPEHLRPVAEHLLSLDVSPSPEPWRLIQSFAVGGLTDIGFGSDTDLLLVVSSQGRGLIDCIAGEKTARDADDSGEYQQYNECTADGIGDLGDQRISIGGLHGGGLSNSTPDGWSCAEFVLVWPHHSVFLVQPWKSPYELEACTKLFDESEYGSEFRATGFSPTGRSFVLATSADLTVWGRTT